MPVTRFCTIAGFVSSVSAGEVPPTVIELLGDVSVTPPPPPTAAVACTVPSGNRKPPVMLCTTPLTDSG